MINLLLMILTYRNNDKIIMIYFFNMFYDVYNQLVKFQFKTPPMHGEIKKQIVLGGNLNRKT